MKRFYCAAVALVLSLVLLAGCGTGRSTPSREDGKLSIVATIFPHYDFARAVAGDAANLTMLLKPGAESHSYDPSPADILTIQNADIFIYTGGSNDAWVETILESMDTSNMLVLNMMEHVDVFEEELVEGMQAESEEEHADEGAPELDQHIWTSPVNAMAMVRAVQNALQEKDPSNAQLYSNNAKAYLGKLQALDAELRDIVATGKRDTLVFADRFPFRYFIEEYGLQYRAVFPGCSVDCNPSAGTVAFLIDYVRDNNIPYIYTIELSTANIAQVITEETGVESLSLESCQSLTKTQFEAGETYVSLMQNNAENLRKGLQ